jgi:NTP pyrophosphatase (non-canonical NTP hydrolase)
MTLNDLSKRALADSVSWFPHLHAGDVYEKLGYFALALGGEAGELQNVVKKIIRDGLTPELVDSATEELADVVTYALLFAGVFHLDLDAALEAKRNICVERWGTHEV